MAAFLAKSSRSFRVGTSSIATTARGMGRSRSLANAAAMSYLSSTRGGGSVTSATNWCGARRTLQSSCPTLSSTVEATTESATGTSIEHPSFEIVSTDVISEYGADCTLYRHKKSGAELLSVSTGKSIR